ncbi:MAG TPA: VanZ family protein [Puia sp.]|nr:VanZ family protein [Puia sp.]
MISLLKKYFHHIYYALGWSLVILILLSLPGSMLPEEKVLNIPNLDKIVHVGLFGGFVLLWCTYIASKHLEMKRRLVLFFCIFAIGCLYGTGMEFVQKYFIPSRDFELGDILADVVGASLGYGFCNIFLVV